MHAPPQLLFEQAQHGADGPCRVETVTELVGITSPDLLHRQLQVAGLVAGDPDERRPAPWLEVHADRAGPGRAGELEVAGAGGDEAAVGERGVRVADAEGVAEVENQHGGRHRREFQPLVRRRARKVVEVVDQLVERRLRNPRDVVHDVEYVAFSALFVVLVRGTYEQTKSFVLVCWG